MVTLAFVFVLGIFLGGLLGYAHGRLWQDYKRDKEYKRNKDLTFFEYLGLTVK